MKKILIEMYSDVAEIVASALETRIDVYDEAITAVEDCGEEDFDVKDTIGLAEGNIAVEDLIRDAAEDSKDYQETLDTLQKYRDLLNKAMETINDEIAKSNLLIDKTGD